MVKTERNYNIEFEAIRDLEGFSRKYLRVPDEILLNKKMESNRVALYIYLYIHKGLNDVVNFSVPLFLSWAGFKSDTHSGGLNDRVLDTLFHLSDLGYITIIGDKKLTRTSCVEIKFNTDLVEEKCYSGDRFAIVYLDEVDSIIKYKKDNKKDTVLHSFSILLVFVYFRRCIPRRPNELKPEERFEDRIIDRRNRLPEAYNGKYIDIAAELYLGDRTVAKATEILRKLHLIALGVPYRIKNIDGEYRTPDFLFSNCQKRDKGKLLADGKEYAETEIKLKAKQMHEYHKQYGINYSIMEILC